MHMVICVMHPELYHWAYTCVGERHLVTWCPTQRKVFWNGVGEVGFVTWVVCVWAPLVFVCSEPLSTREHLQPLFFMCLMYLTLSLSLIHWDNELTIHHCSFSCYRPVFSSQDDLVWKQYFSWCLKDPIKLSWVISTTRDTSSGPHFVPIVFIRRH